MGNCVPVHRSSDRMWHRNGIAETEMWKRTMELQLSVDTKTESGLVGSCLKEEAILSNGHLGPEQLYKSRLSSNSIEEIYFDSIPWMESDNEDFYSVNGDFTPSRGNSPIHQSIIDSPQLSKPIKDVAANMVSECSPNDNKKLLIELFRESFSNESKEADRSLQAKDEVKSRPVPFSHISFDKSPYELSDNCSESSRATSHVEASYVTVKSRSKPCCIPNLVRSLSFSETKKKLCFSDTSGGY